MYDDSLAINLLLTNQTRKRLFKTDIQPSLEIIEKVKAQSSPPFRPSIKNMVSFRHFNHSDYYYY